MGRQVGEQMLEQAIRLKSWTNRSWVMRPWMTAEEWRDMYYLGLPYGAPILQFEIQAGPVPYAYKGSDEWWVRISLCVLMDVWENAY